MTMSVNQLPVLFSFRRCPYAMRARLAFVFSRQQCELREVILRDKPQALLDASPKGTVPVLVLPDGKVIDESLDIMRWLLAQNDPQGMLSPAQGSLEQMLELIHENDTFFKARLDRYKYPVRYGLPSGQADRDVGAFWLRKLNDRLASSAYLYGEHASLADVAIAPFVRQYAHTDRDWFRAQDWIALRDWLDAFLQSQPFARIMHKYAAWEPGQQEVVFPPAG